MSPGSQRQKRLLRVCVALVSDKIDIATPVYAAANIKV